MRKILIILCVLGLFLAGCSKNVKINTNTETDTQTAVLSEEYDESTAIKVNISEQNSLEITNSGVYLISGKTENGSITVNAPDCDVQIVLNNADIHNKNGVAIYIKKAKNAVLTVKSGTENYLSDGEKYTITDSNTNVDATVFSKSDLTINGGGKLNIVGNCKNGLVSKDSLIVLSSELSVKSANKGVYGKDAVTISGGEITVDSVDDSIHSEGSIEISGGKINLTTQDDAIHADNTITISNGEITVNTCKEGIESGTIQISGGKTFITATDDGLNASDKSSENNGFTKSTNAALNISGGYLYVNSNGDGIDSNGTINISGGVILVSGPTNDGNGAIDYETSATVSGGTVVALGSVGMAENFTQAENQGSFMCSFDKQEC